ncbi:MAG: 30S ribosomal protein S17 [Bdellovibrionales bacterium]|nr:30S ribosomal protein S17 [Bdellovibrionales bacterium]
MATDNQVSTEKKASSKTREGLVVSNKMQKTVLVAVSRQVKHRTYGKYVSTTRKYMAHDEDQQCQIGDLVRIVETRPLSKNKCWRVQEVLRKAV